MENTHPGPAGSKCMLLVLVLWRKGRRVKGLGCTCKKELLRCLAGAGSDRELTGEGRCGGGEAAVNKARKYIIGSYISIFIKIPQDHSP